MNLGGQAFWELFINLEKLNKMEVHSTARTAIDNLLDRAFGKEQKRGAAGLRRPLI